MITLVDFLNSIAGMQIQWSNRALEGTVIAMALIFLVFTLHVFYLIIRIGGGLRK